MRRLTSLLTVAFVTLVYAAPAGALELGDPRPAPGVTGISTFGPAVNNPAGSVLLQGFNRVALRTASGRWLVRTASSSVALPVERGGFMLLHGTGTIVRSQILRADGTLEPPQDALADALLTWSGDNDWRLWQAAANGRGTVIVASRTAPTADVSGGVIAAIRDPDGAFGPPQLLSPATPGWLDSQNTVLISPVSPEGGASVGWALKYASNPPSVGIQTPWREASRERAGEPLTTQPGERSVAFAVPPGDGPPAVTGLNPRAPLPPGARSVRMYDDAGQVITVGRDVMDLCARRFAKCDHATVVAGTRPSALTFVLSEGGLPVEAPATAARASSGRWVAFQHPDGTYARPQRVTYVPDYAQALIATSGRLELAGTVGGRLWLTPVGTQPATAAARPVAAPHAWTRGRRLTAPVSCSRRCTIRAVARYAGGRSVAAFAHPATYPRPKRRTLDPRERASVEVTLPARLRARRIVLTVTARDVVGRMRTRTFVYQRGRRTGDVRQWRLRRSTAGTA